MYGFSRNVLEGFFLKKKQEKIILTPTHTYPTHSHASYPKACQDEQRRRRRRQDPLAQEKSSAEGRA